MVQTVRQGLQSPQLWGAIARKACRRINGKPGLHVGRKAQRGRQADR